MTPERLIKKLSEQPEALFIWREFSGFLSRAGRDCMSGTKELLMELYDCPDKYQRDLQKESVTVTHLAMPPPHGNFWFSPALKGELLLARTFNPGGARNDGVGIGRLMFSKQNIVADVRYSAVGRTFVPEMGFVLQNGAVCQGLRHAAARVVAKSVDPPRPMRIERAAMIGHDHCSPPAAAL